MMKHFSGHVSDAFSFEFRLPDQPWTSSKVNGNLCQAVVHWQAKSVTFDTSLVSKRFKERFTQCEARIFNSVMFVDLKIPFDINLKIDTAVTGELIQHVIKKSQAR